jgi:hypothetical protein
MYRIGNIVKRFPVYHKRWIEEKTGKGELVPPPGIPIEWHRLWGRTSDFQRCVIYAAGYLRGLLEGIQRLSPASYLVYDHAHLRISPHQTFQRLARFLEVGVSGFQTAVREVRADCPSIPPLLADEYEAIEGELGLRSLVAEIESSISWDHCG